MRVFLFTVLLLSRFLLPGILLLGVFLPNVLLAQAGEEARLLRYPTANATHVVFGYAGDLYQVSRQGGVATRLTSHAGYEHFPRFNRAGDQLAFAAQYHGNTEVYTLPFVAADSTVRGTPKRLTYTATLERDDIADRMGPNNLPMTWTPTGDGVVFRTRRHSFNAFKGTLEVAPIAGGEPTPLPFSVASWCSYAPDGAQLAYNRVFREFRTWKYYRGGMAGDVWIYDFATEQSINISSNPAQDVFPMWHENVIYYCSDRDRTMNLFAYNLETQQTTKVTNFKDFDIKFPSLGPEGIVFEQAGYLWEYTFADEKARKIAVQLPGDLPATKTAWVDASKFVNDAALSPDGARVVLAARGEIWTVPGSEGVTRRLTHSPGAHDRDPAWNPDGTTIAFLSDRSGEYAWYSLPERGTTEAGTRAEPTRLTPDQATYPYAGVWSPDGTKLLWADKELRLQYVDVKSGKITQVAKAEAWEYTQYAWSPDGTWITYTQSERNAADRVWLYELASQDKFPVTDEFFGANSSKFSQDGKYLVFASARTFDPIYSATEWNHAYTDQEKIYLLPLNAETPNPLMPKSDEVSNGESATDEKPGEDAKPVTTVTKEGLVERAIEIPLEAASYGAFFMDGTSLYYLRRKRTDDHATLAVFNFEEKKETVITACDGFEVSHNGKKFRVVSQGKHFIIDRPSGKAELNTPLALGGLRLTVNLAQEWQQIYTEAWRQMRDFFYAPNMHGTDWKGLKAKYAPLVAHVNHRNDLTYIIGELIGELNVGHAYVGGGDRPEAERVQTGLLGATLERAKNGASYKFVTITDGANWSSNLRSPLTEAGVDVSTGDFLLAVNGIPVSELQTPFEELMGTAGRQVELLVNTTPELKGARTVRVVPLADESELNYYAWVQKNIDYVTDKTNGKVGYLHVPDMGPKGLNEFVKHFYPQLNKAGLIIDVRGNGGGNVSPMLIERLQREIAMVSMARNTSPYPNPFQTHIGPKVCLMDRYSASDGDLFPYRFKFYDLGPLIGERSWGGVVGIRGSLPFVDGGYLRKPEFAPYDAQGERWIIEGYGVDPDIVVVNDPHDEFKGKDAQLDKGIEVVLGRMQGQPTGVPAPPPFPNKSR